MASLNLSSDGPAINRSYKSIVDAPLPSGSAASSPTYGQWAVFSVSAPLVNVFQGDTGKESTLRVQSTGEGELVDLIDEFSDGRIQFAYVKVKDQNSGLPKSVLIAWCGEGVPERTKGYFNSHLAAVSKLLHGYHVQVTARSDRDLTPESIIRKVADSSGSKYAGDTLSASDERGPPPPMASKPAFTPTKSSSGSGFKALGAGGRSRGPSNQDTEADEDGWGADAPRVVRTQLEKVAPAYKPTKVNMAELTSQKSEPSRDTFSQSERDSAPSDVVRGGYQPIGKVDIAAIRRQAQESGSTRDDRPTTVKGAYEPVGKVDIAAIKARAQQSSGDTPSAPRTEARSGGSSLAADDDDAPKSLADRSTAFTQSERITSMPKPKVANRFGSQSSSFAGTKAPTFGASSTYIPSTAPVGTASKNYADQGGKTPAQLWAERKARERGTSGASDTSRPAAPMSPIQSQQSGGAEWQSGYGGKKWGPVSTTKTGGSMGSDAAEQSTMNVADEEEPSSGGIGAIRDRFKNAPPMGRPTGASSSGFDDDGANDEEEDRAPPPPMGSRPNVGGAGRVAIPGFARPTPAAPQEEEEDVPAEETANIPTPPRHARSPTPPTPEPVRSDSPIRIAMPTSRGSGADIEPPEERSGAAPMPTKSLSKVVPEEDELDDDRGSAGFSRGAAIAAASASLGAMAAANAPAPGAGVSGKRAVVQYDYEKAEDNELELKEGETVVNIEMVDEDWWMGENSRGEKGLFPSNYVELVEEEAPAAPAAASRPAAPQAAAASQGPSAIAEFEYEAAEDNELSFPEGAKITSLEFPDEDWWSGTYNGKSGLFPANYVPLEE